MVAVIERIWSEDGLDGTWVEATLPFGRVKLYRSAGGSVTVGHGESVEAWADDDVLAWVDGWLQRGAPMWVIAQEVEREIDRALRTDRLLLALCAVCRRSGIDPLSSIALVGEPIVTQAVSLLGLLEDEGDIRAALVERGVL